MRGELGYPHPAYLLHEAVTWSPYHRQWFVLPRRISKDAYDEALDERKGANTIIQAAPDFSTLTHSTVGVSLRVPLGARLCVVPSVCRQSRLAGSPSLSPHSAGVVY